MPGLDSGIACQSAQDPRPSNRPGFSFAGHRFSWRPSPAPGDRRHQPPRWSGRPIVKRDMTRI